MRADPCKASKCLKYPICKQQPSPGNDVCRLLADYITDYIKVINHQSNNSHLSPPQIKCICRIMLSIFPKFEWMSFTISKELWGTINYKEQIYSVIEDNSEKYNITTYRMDGEQTAYIQQAIRSGRYDRTLQTR